MRSGDHSSDLGYSVDALAANCPRFWVQRGTDPDTSDDGFLVDPQSPHDSSEVAVPFEVISQIPMLGLIGEPGMGKSTVLKLEAGKLRTASAGGEQLLEVDLAACGTDAFVYQRLFESAEFRSWKEDPTRKLCLFLDGFDTCLQYVQTLVALLLERFRQGVRDGLSIRIACRSADWPPDLEAGLKDLWGEKTSVFVNLRRFGRRMPALLQR